MHIVDKLAQFEAAKLAIRALIAKHMDNLEQQLILERKYPDWEIGADAEFDKLDHKMTANAIEIANALTLALQPARYQAYEQGTREDMDKRLLEQSDALSACL